MRFCETLQNFCEAAAAWRSKISQILDHDHVNDSSVDTRTHAKTKNRLQYSVAERAQSCKGFAEKLLTNPAVKVIIFRQVCESVGMVDKHV